MTTKSPHQPCCWARRRFAVAALGLLALSTGVTSGHVLAADAKGPASVRLVVDYGDGVETHFTALKWANGMTALDALSAAKSHKHGISFEQRGSADTALVTKIGDLKNEGNGKNWLYSVNGKPGEVSAGIQPLKAGDAVLWKFQTYDYNQ